MSPTDLPPESSTDQTTDSAAPRKRKKRVALWTLVSFATIVVLAGVAGALMSAVFNFGVATQFVWSQRRRPRRSRVRRSPVAQ